MFRTAPKKRVATVRQKTPAEAWQSYVAPVAQPARPQSVFDVAGDQPDLEDMIAWVVGAGK